jgi:hypothetical protein
MNAETQHPAIKPFDLSMIKDNALVLIIGKRATGKSFLVRDVLQQHRDIPFGVAVSCTEPVDKLYSTIMPSEFVHEEYTPEVVENMFKRQRRVNAKTTDPRAFLVLDNCFWDARQLHDKCIRNISMNGCCYKMLVIMTMPYPLDMHPITRSNADFVFIFRDTYVPNKQRIYDHYASSVFTSFEAFCQALDRCEAHECLVISRLFSTCAVFFYKAQMLPRELRLCAPEYWTTVHMVRT